MPKKKKPDGEARSAMKALGVYRQEFEPIIRIYGQLQEQYAEITGRFEASGFTFEEDTQTGTKKAPIVTTLENLRKDILTYAAQLGLTPAGLRKIKDTVEKKKGVSVLEAALNAMSAND